MHVHDYASRSLAFAEDTDQRLIAIAHEYQVSTLDFFAEEEDASDLIRSAWRDNLLSCVKRSTIGAFALGALEADWADYVEFHIHTSGCEVCAANLEDLKDEGKAASSGARERLFTSSIGFLKKVRR